MLSFHDLPMKRPGSTALATTCQTRVSSFGDRFRTDDGEVLDPLGLLHGRLEWRLSAHRSLTALESSALAGARRPGRGYRGACSTPCGLRLWARLRRCGLRFPGSVMACSGGSAGPCVLYPVRRGWPQARGASEALARLACGQRRPCRLPGTCENSPQARMVALRGRGWGS